MPWNFWPGVAPCSGQFQNFCRNRQRQNGAFRVVKLKKAFFGKNLFNFFHKAICGLAIEWATKKCCILDAVTALLHIDNWKKMAKNTKKWPTGSDRKRHFRCGSWSNPNQSTPIRHKKQCSTIVCSTRVALRPAAHKI